MGARFSLLILIFAIFVSVHAEQTYESERLRLHEEALRNGSSSDQLLIITAFNRNFLEVSFCDMFDEALDGKEVACDREPGFRIKGISKKGRETLISAAKAYKLYQLDLLDERARLFVAFCETGINDPDVIASEIADIRESMFELELQFYEQVVGELDESDVLHLERFNSESFGAARPRMTDTYRRIGKTLAARFPQEYRQEHLKHCVAAVENKGLPFKLFGRGPYRHKDCERTTYSYGTNGEEIVSTTTTMVDGCATKTEYYEYTAQKPERPGDVELTYE